MVLLVPLAQFLPSRAHDWGITFRMVGPWDCQNPDNALGEHMAAEHDTTIAAPEQLGVHARESFRDRAFQALDGMEEGEGTLVVDLTKTFFVDTAGLGVLADVQRRAAQRKHAVRLRGVNDDIRFTLVLSRMEELFVIESNGNGNGH